MEEAKRTKADINTPFSRENLWESLSQVADIGIFWKDKERRFVGANQFFLDFYGFDSVDVILGRTDEDMGWHPAPDAFKEDELRVLSLGEKTHLVQGVCVVRGEERLLAASKFPIYQDGEIVGLMGYFMDITEDIRSRRELMHIANTDGLTGIWNRRAFELELERRYRQAEEKASPLSCLMTDIDFFKEYNDLYGHLTGDECLKRVAAILMEVVRDREGIAARYGGEEFIILLLADREGAVQVGREIQERLEREGIRHEGSGIHPYLTVSIGITTEYTENVSECWGYITRADQALYMAKQQGRNCIWHLGETE